MISARKALSEHNLGNDLVCPPQQRSFAPKLVQQQLCIGDDSASKDY